MSAGEPAKIHDDFSFQVETGQFIEIFFPDLQAVADENQRRGKMAEARVRASIDESVRRRKKEIWIGPPVTRAREDFDSSTSY